MTDQEIEAIRALVDAGYRTHSNELRQACRTLLSALDAARASQMERELRLVDFVMHRASDFQWSADEVERELAAFDEQEKAP